MRWWVVLACKLKEPGGNALLTRYLGLLDAASRQAVGSLVLRQFIAHDTRHPTLDEGIAHANAHAPQRYQGNQQRYQNAKAEHKQYYEADFQKTQEQVFEECKREKMSEYLGSAIGEKGTLALTPTRRGTRSSRCCCSTCATITSAARRSKPCSKAWHRAMTRW